jgi:hypothetical protein
MNKAQDKDKDRKMLFYILGLVFIEIRATDDLYKARALADIFHNVPSKIRSGAEFKNIELELLEKSKRHGLEKLIMGMLRDAWKFSE